MKLLAWPQAIILCSLFISTYGCKYQDDSRPSRGGIPVVDQVLDVIPNITSEAKASDSERLKGELQSELEKFYNSYSYINKQSYKVIIDFASIPVSDGSIERIGKLMGDNQAEFEDKKEQLVFLLNAFNFHALIELAKQEQNKNDAELQPRHELLLTEVQVAQEKLSLESLHSQIISLGQELFQSDLANHGLVSLSGGDNREIHDKPFSKKWVQEELEFLKNLHEKKLSTSAANEK